MTLPRFLAIAVVAIPLSVAGCQTTGGKSGSPTYTVFFDQGDHLEQLLAEQNHAAAVRLHNEHQDYFLERRETYQAELQLLADHIEKTFEVRLARAEEGLGSVGWPSPTADWPRMRMALDEVGTTVADYDRRHLAGGAFRSERFHRIGARRAALHEEIEVAAADEFARFDHFAGQSFFTRYPIDLDGPAFMSEHFEHIADTVWASPADALVRFLKTYQEGDVLAADLRAEIGAKYVALTLEAEMAGAGGGLAALMRTVAKAAAADIEISSLPDARFGLVEATSRTLLEQGQIQFPVAIEADLPFDVATADLDDALSTAVGEAADYLIVFDVALAKAERRIRARKGHSSKFLAGTREVPNPSYATKQFELVAAQQELQGVRLRNALNNSSNTADATIFGAMIEAIVEGIVERKADEAVEEALAALQSTPRTVSEPIFEPYAYSSAEVEARRLLTVNYYVIDRARGTYFNRASTPARNESSRWCSPCTRTTRTRNGILTTRTRSKKSTNGSVRR